MPESSHVEFFDRPGGEPVVLQQPSPQWVRLADRWIAAIEHALSDLRPRVEHIGSTAVPGLAAKPVIDLQVSVEDVDAEETYRPPLESLGLVVRAREPGHLFLRPPAGSPRTVHVHVCQQGSSWERDHLLFRDQLRARPEVASAYAQLKERLADDVGLDRAAYTEGKSEFIRQVVASAHGGRRLGPRT